MFKIIKYVYKRNVYLYVTLTYYVVAHFLYEVLDATIKTYYVVVQNIEEINICSLLPIATLPAGFIEFSDLIKSEGTIRTSFLKKRGVYLWTNKINGQQY